MPFTRSFDFDSYNLEFLADPINDAELKLYGTNSIEKKNTTGGRGDLSMRL